MPETHDDKKEGNPRAASTRIGSASAKTLAGQIRHDLRRGPQPKYVDAARLDLNRVLIEPLPPGQMRKICEERRALRDTQRAIKSNAAVATRGVITFGSEAAEMFDRLTPEQQDAAFRELAEAIAARLATSLHGLVVHMDEATIHAHYQLAAYNIHGNPIAKTTSPRVLSELQDITAEIMGRHCPGIERGRSYGERIAAGADFADTIHKAVRELHRTLPADLEAKRREVAELDEAKAAAQVRVDEMMERLQKLEAKGELTDKENKRCEIYAKRLTDRVAELEEIAARSMAARAEEDRLAELARANRQAEEQKADRITAKSAAVSVAVAALVEEITDGTITRTADGKIRAKAPEKLKPGYPEVGPLVQVAATFVSEMSQVRQVAFEEARQEGLEIGQKQAADQLDQWRDRVQSILERAKAYLGPLRSFLKDELAPQSRIFATARRLWSPGTEITRGLKDLSDALEREATGYRAGKLGEMQRAQDAPLLAAHKRTLAVMTQGDTSAPQRAQPSLDESRPGL